ncbi:hypothetical protein IQ270_25630 [Microcoleus sp. LEGE 07076]|uniref:hypothetical protein n=1 Tax=Microcoleus sp. LEGE 07076 TaxID=915322 RepID=UPI001881144A|nr:hypothetical protein [Microcoleus sp. LEGE 07076]MBE9187927.1 hypothetical protein [Microcoleus sp. LEGE 07076]
MANIVGKPAATASKILAQPKFAARLFQEVGELGVRFFMGMINYIRSMFAAHNFTAI